MSSPLATPLASDDAAELLRRHSLRVTAPRLAVMRELADHPHADVDTLTQGARASLGSVSTQAVYDVLRALARVGLVRRFEPAGHPARFELELGDNHHHLVCRSCGTMSDVECAPGAAPCLTAADDKGYSIDEAEVIYWGYCPDCSAP
ncbi:Fur family transcriptional regulator [Marihabitans asiaticum]|uniref:Fur family ferric uptake transcriptional regulator n=1 Tax=Marihabitans asiaticum TaxID=415218 RepID=A0A560WAR1_9MICO|nr:Fur family transcriptional regulator [Marihabitans asiaticum]TWD14640.1 Fur family ferric uptake transcriptional regulator [Marihabitans asiaticum]